jgi:iron complex transport system substrate-binding protein
LADPAASSGEIDRQVKEALQEALSVYQIHEDMLARLQPDLILTQSQCEVCAVSLKDVERALCTWIDSRPHLVSLEPNALTDIWTDITSVAEALGIPDTGSQLIDSLQHRIDKIGRRVQVLSERPTVACIEWIDPLMAAGNWVPELVELAGGVNLLGQAGMHSPWMTWEDLSSADPDVVVILPCGFDIRRTRQELPVLTKDPRWAALRAVQHKRVYLTDGNQYFNRPGPRLVDSLEILAEILHPEAFQFGHERSGWERVAWA